MKTWTRYVCCSLLLSLALLDAGCGTVGPRVVKHRQASLDVVPDARGNLQNSGALWFTNLVAAGRTNRCLVVTDSAHARYVALVARWGSRFVPPLSQTGEVWLVQSSPFPLWAIAKPRVVDWATMNKWADNPQMAPAKKASRAPTLTVVFACVFAVFFAVCILLARRRGERRQNSH